VGEKQTLIIGMQMVMGMEMLKESRMNAASLKGMLIRGMIAMTEMQLPLKSDAAHVGDHLR
jgi:hypothetical protein